MPDQLDQELRRLVRKFVADVAHVAQLAAFRSVQSAFDGIADRADRAAAGDGDIPPPRRPAPRRTLTADQLAMVRAQLATLIRERPGQTTAELARAVGIPSGRLRPQLRQLADAGVIHIDTRSLGGPRRNTYRAAEPPPGQPAKLPAVLAGAAA